MAKARLGESYLQIVPVIGNLAAQIASQLQGSVQTPQLASAANSVGGSIGTQTGNAAGQAAATGMGAKIMAGIAALGIAKVLSEAITQGFEQQGSDNKIAAALNLSSKEAAKVAEATRDVYTSAYGESYEAVNENMMKIVGSIKGAKDMSSEELSKMSKDVENLSSTYDLDGGLITQAIQSMIGTGLASDWDDAVSTILAGYQTLGSSGEDWLDSLNEFSDDFVQFGLNGKDGLKLVNAAVKAGIKDTDAFVDGLNEVGIKINDMSADEAYKALGMDPNQIRKNMKEGGDVAKQQFVEIIEKLQKTGDRNLWAQVFGTKSEDYFKAFQDFDISSLNKELEDGVGNMEKFDETLNKGANSSMETFKRTVSEAFIQTLMPALNAITPLIASFVSFLKENEWAATALAIVIGGVMVASLVAAAVAAWSFVAPFLPLIGTVLLVVAAIAAVVAIVWLLAANWDTIVKWMTDVWNGFVGWISGVWNGFVGWWMDSWAMQIQWVTDGVAAIGNFFIELGKGIANFFIGVINNVVNGINFLIEALNGIQFDMPDWMGGGSWGGFNIPTIPQVQAMKNGGVVPPSPGGSLKILAEAGRAEAVVDEGKLNKALDINNSIMAGAGVGGGTTFNIYQQPGESTEELVQRIDAHREFTGLRDGYNYNA